MIKIRIKKNKEFQKSVPEAETQVNSAKIQK